MQATHETATETDNTIKKQGFIHQTSQEGSFLLKSIIGFILGAVVFIVAAVGLYFFVETISSILGLDNSLEDHLLLTTGFLAFYPAFYCIQKLIYKMPWRSVITSAAKFRWRLLFRSALIYGSGMLILALIDWITGDAVWVYDSSTYWSFFIITLLFIPFQAAAEEIWLRGFLNQFLVRYLKNPWVVYVLSSMVFTSLHFANPEADLGYFVEYSLLLFIGGFTACILTHYTNGLEAAIGMHIINNLIVFSILSYDIPEVPQTYLLSNGEMHLTTLVVIGAVIFELAMAALIIWLYRKGEKQMSA